MIVWTSSRTRQAPVETCWRADEIVVTRGAGPIDRLPASAIERVTLVHAGEGESPGEVRAALFELTDRAVVLGAASGIASRVLFERQAYWSRRNCIYWVCDRRVRWPSLPGEGRWPFERHRLPQHRTLSPAAVASLLGGAEVSGPHTWDERKRHRIERRRPFPGHAIGAPPVQGGVLG